MPEFEIELLSDEEPEEEEGQFEIELMDDEPETDESTISKVGRVAKRIGQSALKGTADISMGIASTYEHKGLIRKESLTPEQRGEIRAEFQKRGLSTEEEYHALVDEYVEQTEQKLVKRHTEYAESVPEIDEPVFKGGVAGILEEAATGISRFAPSMVTSAIPGAEALGFVSTYTQLKGQKYDELVKEGYDKETANDASDIHAITSAPLEFLGNILQIKGATKIINAAIKKMKLGQRGAGILKAMIMGGAGEGIEEFTQEHAEVIADVYADDPTASHDEIAEKVKEIWADPQFQKSARRAAGVGAVGGMMIPGAAAVATVSFNTAAWLKERRTKKAAKNVTDQIITIKDTLGVEEKAKVPTTDIDKAFEGDEEVEGVDPASLSAGVSNEQIQDSDAKAEAATARKEQMRLEVDKARNERKAKEAEAQKEAQAKQQEAETKAQERAEVEIQAEMERFQGSMITEEGAMEEINSLLKNYETDPDVAKQMKPVRDTHKALEVGEESEKKLRSLAYDLNRQSSELSALSPKMPHVFEALNTMVLNRIQEIEQQKLAELKEKAATKPTTTTKQEPVSGSQAAVAAVKAKKRTAKKAKLTPKAKLVKTDKPKVSVKPKVSAKVEKAPVTETKVERQKRAAKETPAAGQLTEESEITKGVTLRSFLNNVVQEKDDQVETDLLTVFNDPKADFEDYVGPGKIGNMIKTRLVRGGMSTAEATKAVAKGMKKYEKLFESVRTGKPVAKEKVAPKAKKVATKATKMEAVAFRMPDGTVVKGKPGQVHAEAFERVPKKYRKGQKALEAIDEGFVDTEGNYYTREEAGKAVGEKESKAMRKKGILKKKPEAKVAKPKKKAPAVTEEEIEAEKQKKDKPHLPRHPVELKVGDKVTYTLSMNGVEKTGEVFKKNDKEIVVKDTEQGNTYKIPRDGEIRYQLTVKDVLEADEVPLSDINAMLQKAKIKLMKIAKFKALESSLALETVAPHVYQQLKAEGKLASAQGAYDPLDGTIYLFANTFNDMNEVQIVTWHELGHWSLRDVLGTDVEPLLDRIRSKYNKEVVAYLDRHGFENTVENRKRAAEEVLIAKHTAGDITVKRRLTDLLLALAKKLGFKGITEKEVNELLNIIKDNLTQGSTDAQIKRAKEIAKAETAATVQDAGSGQVRYLLDKMKWDYAHDSEIFGTVNTRLAKEVELFEKLFGASKKAQTLPGKRDTKTGKRLPMRSMHAHDLGQELQRVKPELKRYLDPKISPDTLANERELKGKARLDFLTELKELRSGPLFLTEKTTKKILSINAKAGMSADFLLATCQPTTPCAECYAAKAYFRMTAVRKAFRNTAYILVDQKGWAAKVAEEARKIPQTKMQFIRLLGSGDLTTKEQVDAFNELAKVADRPIQIFSRHHDNLAKLKGTATAPFIKMGSVDSQLYKHYGHKYLKENMDKRGIANAWLYTSEKEIPMIQALAKDHALGLVLAARTDLHNKLPAEQKAASCPCDAEERNYMASCRQCALGQNGCFMAFANKGFDKDGKVGDLGTRKKLSPFTMFMQEAKKELGLKAIPIAYSKVAQDVVQKSIALVKLHQRDFRDGKRNNIPLKDVRFPEDVVYAETMEQADAYIENMQLIKQRAGEGTFALPGGEIQPPVEYKDFEVAKLMTKEEMKRLKPSADKLKVYNDVMEIVKGKTKYPEIFKHLKGLGVKFRFFDRVHPKMTNAVATFSLSDSDYEGVSLNENDLSLWVPNVMKSKHELDMTLAHEGLHGIIKKKLRDANPAQFMKFKLALGEFMSSLEPWINEAPAVPKRMLQVAEHIAEDPKKRIEEIVTYAFTEPEVAGWLNQIPAEGTKTVTDKPTMWDRLKRLLLEFAGFDRTKMDELSDLMNEFIPVETVPVRYALSEDYQEATRSIGPQEKNPDQIRNVGMSWGQKVHSWLADSKKALQHLEGGDLTLAQSAYKSFNMLHSFGVILNQFLEHGSVQFKENWINIVPGADGLFGIAKKLGKDSEHFFNRMTALSARELLVRNKEDMAEAAKKVTSLKRQITTAKKEVDFDKVKKLEKELKAARRSAKGRFGPDRNLFGKDVKGNMIDDNQMIDTLLAGTDQLYQSNKKVWDAAQKRLREINSDVLDFAEQAGLIDAETRKDWERANYVPFYRNMEDFAEGDVETLFPGAGQEIKTIKRLKGTKGKTIGDPFANLINAYSFLLYDGLRNVARKKGLTLAMDAELLEQVTPSAKGQKGVVQIRTKGKSKFYKVIDPWLYDAIVDLDATGKSIPVLSHFKRALTWGVTLAPGFRLRNAFRDNLHTFFIGSKFIPVWDSMKGLYHVWKETPEFTEYAGAGGAFMGSFATHEMRGKTAKEVQKLHRKALGEESWFKKYWNAWEKVGQASENAARMGLYLRLRQSGKTAGDAAYEARDLLDFHRTGKAKWVQAFISFVPFLNARIQGLSKMGRNAFDVRTRKHMALRGALLATAALMLGMDDAEDDAERMEEPEWSTRTYFTAKIFGKKIRLPLPFETGSMFWVIPYAMGQMIKGARKTREFGSLLYHVMMDTFSFNPIPQMVKPAVEVAANYDIFRGQHIVTQREEALEPFMQYSPRTHKMVKALAKKLNVSPKKVDHLLRGYLGTTYDIVGDMFDVGMEYVLNEDPAGANLDRLLRVSGVGSFYKGDKVPAYTRSQEHFYDMLKEYDRSASTLREMRKLRHRREGRAYQKEHRDKISMSKKFGRAQRKISKLNEQMRLTHANKKLSAQEKRERLDKFLAQRNEQYSKVVDKAKKRMEK